MALTQAIQDNFHHVTIEVISTNIFSDQPSLYDVPTIGEIFKKFQIDLTGIRFRYQVLDYHNGNQWDQNFKKIAALSKNYDLFINCQYNLYHTLSKKSLYICHFPHLPINKLALGRIQRQQIKKLYVSSYDVFLPNSEFTGEWLTRYWPSINKSKRRVLHPPVPVDTRRAKPDWEHKQNIILTCGRFEPEKKLLELVEIFNNNAEQFPDYEFHIAGTAYLEDPTLLNYYQDLRKMAATNKRIKLHPNISFDKLTALYEKARIYWHGMGYLVDQEKDPIKTEHFGMTIIEAMSHGCIPVVHNSGYPPVIVRKTGLDTIWEDRKEAIGKLVQLTQREDIDMLATRAYEASKEYSTENFKLNLRNIIREKKLIKSKFFN
jgi:glycosyltransferase involved in cell wall biosynthesis